jgi:YrbI family 3-deoxy-D-manno-octulosonate 8-phosphate phosphatase
VAERQLTDDARFARVRLLVLDFDGVLTDNTVTVTSEGVESVTCWRGDGIGTAALIAAGIPVVVLSKERDPVVAVRCAKLGLPCQQGVDDKQPALERLLAAHGVDAADAAYVGNDTNDLGPLQLVGLPIVVADAHPDVIPIAGYVTRAPGGRGAVREVCDRIIAARAQGDPQRSGS